MGSTLNFEMGPGAGRDGTDERRAGLTSSLLSRTCFHSRDRRCAEAQFDLPDFWTAFKVTLLGFLSFVVNAGVVWAFWGLLSLFRLVIGILQRAKAMMLLSDSVYGHGGDGPSHRAESPRCHCAR